MNSLYRAPEVRAETTAPALEFADVFRIYRSGDVETVALRGLSLRVERGDGTPNDLETIYSAGKNIMGNTICALGDAAAMPTMSYFEKFKDEFVAHVRDHKCPYPEHEDILPSGWVL